MTKEYRTPELLRQFAFWIASVAALVGTLVLAAALLDQFSSRTETTSSTWSGVQTVELEVGRGDVEIVPSRTDVVAVRVEHRSGILNASSTERQEGDALKLHAGCRFFLLTCNVDYRIEVPDGTSVEVDALAGELRATNIRGKLELDTRAGDVVARNVSGSRVELRTRAGDAEATGIRSRSVAVRSAAGDADATLLIPPDDLIVETHAGDATAHLPDVRYRVDATTDAGDTSVKVKLDDRSPRVVKVSTNAGDARVLPLSRR